jgi:hypothetical protein
MTTTTPSLDREECLRKLAEAGIKGKDAKTSMTVIENRLSPLFFLPRLRAQLEEIAGEPAIDQIFSVLFGTDAGRAAKVIAYR